VRKADGGFALAEPSMGESASESVGSGSSSATWIGHGGFAGGQMSQMSSVIIAIEDASRRGKGTPWE
jgi:hypothetical protein